MTAHALRRDGAAADLDETIRRLADLRQRARGGLWCGGGVVGGGIPASSNLLEHGAGGLLPVALALLALFAAFAWMVRRWGARPPALSAVGPAVPRPLPADRPATTPRALPSQPRSATAGRARSGHWPSRRPDHRSARPGLTLRAGRAAYGRQDASCSSVGPKPRRRVTRCASGAVIASSTTRPTATRNSGEVG